MFNETDLKEFAGGERCYDIYHPLKTIPDHTARYEFAKRFIPLNGTVIDAACGSGYGSKILSKIAGTVYGFDISQHAITYAEKHCQKDNIKFSVHNLEKANLPFTDKSVDAIICLETIEHIKNQEKLIAEFSRILKPKGIFIISTPDIDLIPEGERGTNIFHIRNLNKNGLIELLRPHFSFKLYGQISNRKPSFLGRISNKFFNKGWYYQPQLLGDKNNFKVLIGVCMKEF